MGGLVGDLAELLHERLPRVSQIPPALTNTTLPDAEPARGDIKEEHFTLQQPATSSAPYDAPTVTITTEAVAILHSLTSPVLPGVVVTWCDGKTSWSVPQNLLSGSGAGREPHLTPQTPTETHPPVVPTVSTPPVHEQNVHYQNCFMEWELHEQDNPLLFVMSTSKVDEVGNSKQRRRESVSYVCLIRVLVRILGRPIRQWDRYTKEEMR
jgi:hypothetical protein